MIFRFVLPAIFLLLGMLFVAVNIMGAGHGSSTFDFVLYCAYPACLLIGLVEPFLGEPDLLWFFLCMIAGALQYFLIGYFIDKLLQRRRRLKTEGSN